MTTILSIAEAERLVAEAFSRADVGPAQAASVAHALVAAEASGQGGHGLRRVAAYSAQAKAGKVKGHATPEIELTRSAAMRVERLGSAGWALLGTDDGLVVISLHNVRLL